jgi:hypothetical protein
MEKIGRGRVPCPTEVVGKAQQRFGQLRRHMGCLQLVLKVVTTSRSLVELERTGPKCCLDAQLQAPFMRISH